MTRSAVHDAFAPLKRALPVGVSGLIRRAGTAILTPLFFSLRSGHFRSSMKTAAVTKSGKPLPWYTYPCIDFLRGQDFSGRSVLEFGGGQSTFYWASRAAHVVTFEGKAEWFRQLEANKPANAQLHLLPPLEADPMVRRVDELLGTELFDVIVIDGLKRSALIAPAIRHLRPSGMIICDNSEGYGIQEGFGPSGFSRIDFYGHAPGVYLPHCTSVFFKDRCDFLSNQAPILVPALFED